MPNMEKIELDRCPFCGSDDIRIVCHKGAGTHWHHGEDVYTIGCYPCGGSVPGMYDKGLLIKSWNQRADGWVSVNDDGYMKYKRVVVYSPLDEITLKYRVVDPGQIRYMSDVTHWQPLTPPGGCDDQD